MKNCISRLKISGIIIFSLCSGLAFTQNSPQTLEFAGGQYLAGNYDAALSAYQRFLFFNKEKHAPAVYRQIADCYFRLHEYEKAAGYFDLASSSFGEDSIKNEMVFRKIASLLMKDQYDYALMELLGLEGISSSYFLDKQNFYLGITYFGMNRFDSSETSFARILERNKPADINRLHALFAANKKTDRIRPRTAKILSIILPGLGQFYSGDVKSGINSFLITSAFFLLGVKTAATYSFMDAFVSVFPWYQRYYMGGYNKAEAIARKRVRDKRAMVYKEILELLASAKEKQTGLNPASR